MPGCEGYRAGVRPHGGAIDMPRRYRILAALLSVLLPGLLTWMVFGRGDEPQILQDSFEGRDPVWKRGPANADFEEKLHRITEDTSHGGRRCEHLQLKLGEVKPDSFIHYLYPVGRRPGQR